MPGHKWLSPETASQILRKMVQEGWTDEEMGRFLLYWRRSYRVWTIFRWLHESEDPLDKKLNEFLREYLLGEPS